MSRRLDQAQVRTRGVAARGVVRGQGVWGGVGGNFPVIEVVGHATNVNGSSGTATSIDVPVPIGAQPGDVVVAHVGTRGSGTFVTPPGWVKLDEAATGTANFHWRVAVLQGVLEDPVPDDLTFELAAANFIVVIMSVLRHTTGVSSVSSNVTTTSSLNPGAVTVDHPGSLILVAASNYTTSGSSTWTGSFSAWDEIFNYSRLQGPADDTGIARLLLERMELDDTGSHSAPTLGVPSGPQSGATHVVVQPA